jgi:hypothetical protein
MIYQTHPYSDEKLQTLSTPRLEHLAVYHVDVETRNKAALIVAQRLKLAYKERTL